MCCVVCILVIDTLVILNSIISINIFRLVVGWTWEEFVIGCFTRILEEKESLEYKWYQALIKIAVAMAVFMLGGYYHCYHCAQVSKETAREKAEALENETIESPLASHDHLNNNVEQSHAESNIL